MPELTTIGAKRGHTLTSDTHLHPSYGSGADANDPKSNGNGFYTRQEFIELIQYAHDHHIEIIPEINVPGHARAAIKAMEARYKNLCCNMTKQKQKNIC
ncbi:MAG: family 20 glycosylhydrolase [Saprospiraceae bacterium]|nr:family 20 glycosylhydrolase [Saprospiraceae bacterium]